MLHFENWLRVVSGVSYARVEADFIDTFFEFFTRLRVFSDISL